MGKRKRYVSCFLLIFLLAGLLFLVQKAGMKEKQTAEEDFALKEDNKLVVYTAHKEEIYGPIVKEFEERTGIWVEVVAGGTNEMLEQIARENGNDSGDIMFGGGVDSLSAYEDYFEVYTCKQSDVLKQEYCSKQDKWIPFSCLPIVFIYHNKLVYSAGVPRSWTELLDNHWRGKIAYAAPDMSGTSYTALATMLQIMEERGMSQEEALSLFVDNLDGNITDSSGKVLEDVMSGTRLIGITNEESALKKIQMGAELGMVYPTEGTTALPDGTAIIKNAPHRKNAELFMEFTVSEETQRFLAMECNRRPVRTDMEQEPIPNEIHYSLEWAEEHMQEIMAKWIALTE